MKLSQFGWSGFFAKSFAAFAGGGSIPGRVVSQQRGALSVRTESTVLRLPISGRLRHEATATSELPVVGDWVVVENREGERIVARLPRRTVLTRKVAGARAEAQAVAANIDLVVLVMGLDEDFSPKRLERGLHMVWDSGARPVVVLNKADLCPDWNARRVEIEATVGEVPVVVCSLAGGLPGVQDVGPVRRLIGDSETAALVGSSGVGKSTMINHLVDSLEVRTAPVRSRDGRGQHTTTHRELFMLPGGGMVVDNPGIREIQLWGGDQALEKTFDDVTRWVDACRFSDCRHESEPGCAILAALQDGQLALARWESFQKLQGELRHVRLREDQGAARLEREKWKKIHRDMRQRGHRRG